MAQCWHVPGTCARARAAAACGPRYKRNLHTYFFQIDRQGDAVMIRRYFREREKRTLRLCSAIAAIALITMTVPRQSAGQQIARPALSL
jgi:hypothetical protein